MASNELAPVGKRVVDVSQELSVTAGQQSDDAPQQDIYTGLTEEQLLVTSYIGDQLYYYVQAKEAGGSLADTHLGMAYGASVALRELGIKPPRPFHTWIQAIGNEQGLANFEYAIDTEAIEILVGGLPAEVQ